MNYDREPGIIVFLHRDAGFGFIQDEKDGSVFFHSSGVTENSFTDLREGNKVEFIRVESPRGERAIDVKLGSQ